MAINRALREGTILISLDTLTEAFEVLGRKHFRRYIDEEDVRRFLAALTREAEWVEITRQISACRDPKDDKFLSLAVNGKASHLVTGDADLLALDPFEGIQILSPAAFVRDG